MKNEPQKDNATLERYYQRRKQNLRMPSSIKRRVMAHDVEKKPAWHWRQRAVFVSLAISTVFLISLVSLSTMKHPDKHPIEISLIQYHQLPFEQTLLSTKLSNKQAEYYQAYIKNKNLFAAQYKRPAKVLPTHDGGGVTLQLCRKEIINLSDPLIAALSKAKVITPPLEPGEPVMLSFADNGIILKIDKSTDEKMCG